MSVQDMSDIVIFGKQYHKNSGLLYGPVLYEATFPFYKECSVLSSYTY